MYTLVLRPTGAGTVLNSVAVTTPDETYTSDNAADDLTAVYEPTCAAADANGRPFECPAGFVVSPELANSTTLTQQGCCVAAPRPTLSVLKMGPSGPVPVNTDVSFEITVC